MKLERLMRLTIDVRAPLEVGATPAGEQRVIVFEAGRFEGEELRGRLLPGGVDWQRVRADGALEIRAHYLLETDAGERLEVVSEGLRSAPAEVLARLAAGEEVPPSDYYFRTAIRLYTAAPRLAHLNHHLYVSSGVRKATRVELEIYRVP